MYIYELYRYVYLQESSLSIHFNAQGKHFIYFTGGLKQYNEMILLNYKN